MHLVRIGLFSVVLAVTCFVSTVGAQKPHAVLQNPPTGQITLTRPLAERVATARRVLNNPHVQLMPSDSFVLTPRLPYVDGRGALDTYQVSSHLQAPVNTGIISPIGHGYVAVNLFHASGKRFLVDCRVEDQSLKPTTFDVKFSDQTRVETTAVNGLLSFVTPLGTMRAEIGIAGDKAMFGLTGARLRSSTSLDRAQSGGVVAAGRHGHAPALA